MDLNIYTININGLRSKRKQNHIKTFLEQNNVDILCIQETFINNNKLAKEFENFTGLTKRCIWSFGSENSRGVVVIFKNDIIKIDKFHIDFFGRLAYVDFSLSDKHIYRIINVYCPNDSGDRNDFLNDIIPHLTVAKQLILVGDFNFILDTSLDKIGGNLDKGMLGSKIFKNIIDKHKLIDTFRILHPKVRVVTWQRKEQVSTGGFNYIGSRLERFYVYAISKDQIVDCKIIPCPFSDHNFVHLSLRLSYTVSFGKSYWKFNDDLLNDNVYLESFEYFWNIVGRTVKITLEWWDEMKIKIKDFSLEFSSAKRKELFKEYRTLMKQFNGIN